VTADRRRTGVWKLAEQRQVSTRIKHVAKVALGSLGPGPEKAPELAEIRGELADLSSRLHRLEGTMAVSKEGSGDVSEASQVVSAELQRIGAELAAVLDVVHVHQERLAQLEYGLERFAGSVLDQSALERRMSNLEDQLLASAQGTTASRPV